MSILRRNKKFAVIGTICLLVAAGGAYAYWTTTGSGTGSATTGDSAAVTVTQVGAVTALVPGGAAQAVNFTITNGKSTPQYVTTVTYSIASIETAPSTPAVGCSAADFTLVQPNTISADLAAGVTTFSPSGATLAMLDRAGINQDGCKNVTVNLAFSAI